MLQSFSVQRYRGFVERSTVELRPLTLLFGRNSAGKSALLRTLPLLAASASAGQTNRTGPLGLEHPAFRGVQFADLRSKLSPRADIVVSFECARTAPGQMDLDRVEYTIRDVSGMNRTGELVYAAEMSTRSMAEPLRIELPNLDGPYCAEGRALDLLFDGLLPRWTGAPEVEPPVLGYTRSLMQRLHAGVEWLGPLRIVVSRRVQPVPKPVLGHDGSGVTELMASRDHAAVRDWVRQGVERLFEHDIIVHPDGDEVSLLADYRGRRNAHISDVGSGLSQVLPVLAHLGRLATGRANQRIITIEQPEAHLHADAEAELGKLVAQAVASTRGVESGLRPLLVMETHSEALLLALQLAVLEGQLSPEDFVAHWVCQDEDGASRVECIHFDQLARPTPSWPAGVFSESTHLAREILAKRRGRRP